QITNNDQNDFDPAWSADGRSLAFASSSQNDLDVWVLHGDGTQVDVTNDPGFADGSPAWSPDGSQIVFDRANPFTGDGPLVVMNADGSNKRAITDGASVNTGPAWSPDGGTIVFASDRDGNLELYRVNPDGTDLKRLTFTPTTWE